MTSPVFTPLQMFYSTSGLPLTDGYIYIGTASQNPQTNPIAVYWDAAGTIPAAQPIRTSGGYPVRNGSPATVFVLATDFSLIVRDKSSKLVFSRLSGNAFSAEWVTYNPAGTGAVATTAQTKLREISVSVDDYSTPQQAVDYVAGLGGGTVIVPKGVHTLTSTLTLASNVQLVGEGAASVLAYGDGVQGITATGVVGTRLTGISIRNLTLRKIGGTTGQHMVFTFVDDSEISGVTFDGNLGTNSAYSMLRGTRRVSVDGCVFKNGSSIIWWSSDETSGGTWGEGNSVTRCRMNAAKQGFNVIYQRGFTASDCVASGSTSTFGCGFIIEYQNQGVVLTNCVSYGHVRDGFYVEGNIAYGCKDVQFIGCIAYSNGEAGLNCDANFKDVLISGGAFYSNTGSFGGGTGHGLMFAGSESVSVIGAALHDNAAANLVYLSNPYRLTVIGCKIANAGAHGIYFTGTLSEVKIADCTFVSNTSGNINSWVYTNACEWDDGPWVSWSPTWYKQNETTTVTWSTNDAVYRRNNGRVEYQLVAVTPSVALDNNTFFSLPIVGTWPNNSAASSTLRARGFASMDVSGTYAIDGAYANDKLRISKTASGDTVISAAGFYEVI